MEGSRRGTIKPAHTVNGRHCCVLQEEAWIYEAEPDWVVNLTRWARGRSHSLSLFWPYSPPRMPWCMHWARVMLGSRGAEAGLLKLVNALTGVGIQRPPFSDQETQVRGQIAELATAVFNTSPVDEVLTSTQISQMRNFTFFFWTLDLNLGASIIIFPDLQMVIYWALICGSWGYKPMRVQCSGHRCSSLGWW